MDSISKSQMLDLISTLPHGEQRRVLIAHLVATAEISEEDAAALAVEDIARNSDTYAEIVRDDSLLAFLWQRFAEYPQYLARALVRARPDVFYTYGFAFRLVMKLKANLGPVLVPPRRPGDESDPAIFMQHLPEMAARDIFALDVECRFRDALFFMSRDPKLGLEFLNEAVARSESDYDRRVQTEVHSTCTRLLGQTYPDFVDHLGEHPFPSFHVRWWLDQGKDIARVLNIGDTGTHKTAYATIAMHQHGCRRILVVCPPHARPNWAREINAYFRTPDPGRVHIVRNRDEALRVSGSRARYIVLGYSTLIQDGVMEALCAVPFDGFIWDECHYGNHVTGSNPSKRALACATLVRRLPLKRLLTLTATPWDNDPSEFASVAAAMRPDVFPSPEAFRSARARDPRFLREFFAENIVGVALHEIRDLPPITPRPWEDLFGAELVEMNPRHAAVYEVVREDEGEVLKPAQKVGRLLLTSTHPHAVRKHYAGKVPDETVFDDWKLSTKLEWLKERVTRELSGGAKVVVATGIYVTGVTRPEDGTEDIWVGQLLKEWFGDERVLILDGNVPQSVEDGGGSERDALISRWRTDPDVRILLVSMRACPDSVNLSVPLLPGVRKLFITALSYPWVPWKQFLGRFWRDGLGVPVEYRVPVLRGTIDEALLGLVSRKWQIQQLFRALVPLTGEEWRYLDRNIDLRRLAEESRSHGQKVNVIGALVQGRGEEGAVSVLAEAYGTSTNGQVFARSFLALQEAATSGNIARFMRTVVGKMIEQGLVHAEGILDAGCGPLTLERYLNLPAYGVDMNPHMLELARSRSPHQGRNASLGRLSKLPAEWAGRFELTVASLVLDWTSLQGKGSAATPERLAVMAELVRVTHPLGRVWITATRSSMDETILDAWVRALRAQGFAIVEDLTGLVRATDRTKSGEHPFSFWSLCFAPQGRSLVHANPDAFRFAFEHERVRVKRGAGSAPTTAGEASRSEHAAFEVVQRDGTVRSDDDVSVRAAIREIERIVQVPDPGAWRFHKAPQLPLDWRRLAALYRRGSLDEELRRRGLV